MSSIKVLNFSLYIEQPSQVVKVPVRQKGLNSFDNIGNLVSTTRLDNEINADYRKRIHDAAVHPNGPDYAGVSYGMARDFGFLPERTLTIDLKLDSAGSPIAISPRVDILSNRVILYSDWRPNGTAVVDKEIRTYQSNDPGFFLDDLVSEINSSECFSVSIYSGIRPNMHSSNLIGRTSDFMTESTVPTDKKTNLLYPYVIKDSLVFEEIITFRTETESTPSLSGEYKVDYVVGEITSYDLPEGQSKVNYHVGLFPMIVKSTPLQIFTLQDDDFIDELFQKKTLDSGEEIKALPNAEGSDILHQLFLETQMFWSK